MKTNKFFILSLIFGFILTAVVFFIIGFRIGKIGYFYQNNLSELIGRGRRYMYNSNLSGRFHGMRFGHGQGQRCKVFFVRGKIISFQSNAITVLDIDNNERIISTNSVKNYVGIDKLSSLKINDFIFVLGNPDESGIFKADFIRLIHR